MYLILVNIFDREASKVKLKNSNKAVYKHFWYTHTHTHTHTEKGLEEGEIKISSIFKSINYNHKVPLYSSKL